MNAIHWHPDIRDPAPLSQVGNEIASRAWNKARLIGQQEEEASRITAADTENQRNGRVLPLNSKLSHKQGLHAFKEASRDLQF
jgi:hypothetical protein